MWTYVKGSTGSYFVCIAWVILPLYDVKAQNVTLAPEDDNTTMQICKHNFAGENCDVCMEGYFLETTSGHCHICACPTPRQANNFALKCNAHPATGETFSCLCREGYSGRFCEKCADGYYGNPLEIDGSCEKLDCSDNVDTSDTSAYDTETGACLKCLPNYAGRHCERCRHGLHGDAVSAKTECRCDSIGSVSCDHTTGACQCKPNVIGRYCSGCRSGYAGFGLADGCVKCDCACVGGCDVMTGVCQCTLACFYQPLQTCAVLWGLLCSAIVLLIVVVVCFLQRRSKRGEYHVTRRNEIDMPVLWNDKDDQGGDVSDERADDDCDVKENDANTALLSNQRNTSKHGSDRDLDRTGYDRDLDRAGYDRTTAMPLSTFKNVKLRHVARDVRQKDDDEEILGEDGLPLSVRQRVDVMETALREQWPDCDPQDISGDPDQLFPLRVTAKK